MVGIYRMFQPYAFPLGFKRPAALAGYGEQHVSHLHPQDEVTFVNPYSYRKLAEPCAKFGVDKGMPAQSEIYCAHPLTGRIRA